MAQFHIRGEFKAKGKHLFGTEMLETTLDFEAFTGMFGQEIKGQALFREKKQFLNGFFEVVMGIFLLITQWQILKMRHIGSPGVHGSTEKRVGQSRQNVIQKPAVAPFPVLENPALARLDRVGKGKQVVFPHVHDIMFSCP